MGHTENWKSTDAMWEIFEKKKVQSQEMTGMIKEIKESDPALATVAIFLADLTQWVAFLARIQLQEYTRK